MSIIPDSLSVFCPLRLIGYILLPVCINADNTEGPEIAIREAVSCWRPGNDGTRPRCLDTVDRFARLGMANFKP